MPPSDCPVCHSISLRKLDGPSEGASVNYYRCNHCGHVWTTAKKDSGTLIGHVTETPSQLVPARAETPRRGKRPVKRR